MGRATASGSARIPRRPQDQSRPVTGTIPEHDKGARVGGGKSRAGGTRWDQMPGDLYEPLHRNRGDCARAVLARLPQEFSAQDAEDIVSAAMDRVLTAPKLPAPDYEERWFKARLASTGVDELRRRHGRPQGKVKRT